MKFSKTILNQSITVVGIMQTPRQRINISNENKYTGFHFLTMGGLIIFSFSKSEYF